MKKLGLLVLVMIMALGALGVGYAYWSQNLTIGGTITTGELKVQLQNNDDPDPDPYGAVVTSSINEARDRLTVTVTGVYPGYNNGPGQPYPIDPASENNYAAVNFEILNAGTIAVYFTPQYNSDAFAEGLIEVWEDTDAGANPIPPEGRTSVVLPGAVLNGKFIVACQAETEPPQLTTWNFSATFTAHQFNEP